MAALGRWLSGRLGDGASAGEGEVEPLRAGVVGGGGGVSRGLLPVTRFSCLDDWTVTVASWRVRWRRAAGSGFSARCRGRLACGGQRLVL